MQVPAVGLIGATSEFLQVIEEFLVSLFGVDLFQGGDIPAIILTCFTIMLALAVWRIIS